MAEPSMKDYFRNEAKRCLEEAKAITDKVEAEMRDITPEEAEQVEAYLTEAKGYQERVNKIQANEDMRKRVNDAVGVFDQPVEEAEQAPTSWGDAFVKSEGYQRGLQGRPEGFSTGAVSMAHVKANVTTTLSPIVQPGGYKGRIRSCSKHAMFGTCSPKARPTAMRCQWSGRRQRRTRRLVSPKRQRNPSRPWCSPR